MGVRGGPLRGLAVVSPDFDWEAEGYRLGESLHAHHGVVVLGSEPTETALVALGLARAQAARRRVALGDLLGDAPPIRDLTPEGDLHGIVDFFTYGISLNRIAVPVEESENLFILPTGTEPPDYDELLGNPRWRRVIDGFAEAGTLLVLAVPAGARNLEQLVEFAGGAVVIGELPPPQLPLSKVIATLHPPRMALPAEVPSFDGVSTKRPRFSRRTVSAAAGISLTLFLAAASWWFASRPLDRMPRPGIRGDSASRGETIASTFDTGRSVDSLSGAVAPVAVAAPVPANPAESLAAVGYTVLLESNNTIAGALFRQRKDAGLLPAATYVPVVVDGSLWYQTRVGAYPTVAQADSLLQALRRSGRFGDSLSGRVVRARFAFLLDSGVPLTAARGVIAQRAARDEPAYGLRQRDGSVRVYLGAFQTPQEAIPLADSLRARNIDAPLVFRTGRVF